MKFAASPFHPTTGELLPAYRDAYLRGALSKANTARVNAYVATNKEQAAAMLRRLAELKTGARPVRPAYGSLWGTTLGRFYFRFILLLVGGVLLAGAVLAGTHRPGTWPGPARTAAASRGSVSSSWHMPPGEPDACAAHHQHP